MFLCGARRCPGPKLRGVSRSPRGSAYCGGFGVGAGWGVGWGAELGGPSWGRLEGLGEGRGGGWRGVVNGERPHKVQSGPNR